MARLTSHALLRHHREHAPHSRISPLPPRPLAGASTIHPALFEARSPFRPLNLRLSLALTQNPILVVLSTQNHGFTQQPQVLFCQHWPHPVWRLHVGQSHFAPASFASQSHAGHHASTRATYCLQFAQACEPHNTLKEKPHFRPAIIRLIKPLRCILPSDPPLYATPRPYFELKQTPQCPTPGLRTRPRPLDKLQDTEKRHLHGIVRRATHFKYIPAQAVLRPRRLLGTTAYHSKSFSVCLTLVYGVCSSQQLPPEYPYWYCTVEVLPCLELVPCSSASETN